MRGDAPSFGGGNGRRLCPFQPRSVVGVGQADELVEPIKIRGDPLLLRTAPDGRVGKPHADGIYGYFADAVRRQSEALKQDSGVARGEIEFEAPIGGESDPHGDRCCPLVPPYADPAASELGLFDDADDVRVEVENPRDRGQREWADACFEVIGKILVLGRVGVEQNGSAAGAFLAKESPEGGELPGVDGGSRTRLVISGMRALMLSRPFQSRSPSSQT